MEPGFGEEFAAHVAGGFGPLVVLLGQDRADEPDDGGAVGEDADHVGAVPGLLVQPFPRIASIRSAA
ncbi:hypothetical protein GCM10010469_48760 [Streptomyces labedae]|uniref:Uncharacterized protein n=1 Tax=Streptomyces labedae TaxID=285569 RepID=A0ABP6R501_9ACTN